MPEDASEEAIAEATIARMIAEQEQLLNKKESMTELDAPVTDHEEKEQEESHELVRDGDLHLDDLSENEIADTQEQQANNQIDSSIEQDDAELMAAMEEEMIAQLQAEQEEIENSRTDEVEEKTLSDLANKFN